MLEYENKIQPQLDITFLTNHYQEEITQKHFQTQSIVFISGQKKNLSKTLQCTKDNIVKLEINFNA